MGKPMTTSHFFHSKSDGEDELQFSTLYHEKKKKKKF